MLSRPEITIRRGNDSAAGKGHEQTGEVGIEADGTGSYNLIVIRHSQHPLVKTPVTEAAESHAVADIVIL